MTERRLILIWFALASVLVPYFHCTGEACQTHDQRPLKLSGFSVSEAFMLREKDGAAFNANDPVAIRLLYQISQATTEELDRYTAYSQQLPLSELSRQPSDYRLWLYRLRGRVQSITTQQLADTTPDDSIRRCWIAKCVDPSGQPFWVASANAPDVWLEADQLNEPIEVTGFFYAMVSGAVTTAEPSLGANDSELPQAERALQPLFIATQIAWFPDCENKKLGVTPSQVLLAGHGVDNSQWETVRQQRNQRLTLADRPVFFQVLSAVNQVASDQLEAKLSIQQVMSQPVANCGQAVAFAGRVRQCTRVALSEPVSENPQLDSKSFDHYYQLIVFPELDAKIEVANPEGKTLTYFQFPVTVCTRSLPPEMTSSMLEHQRVWIDGFYFRFWKYPSEGTDQAGVSGQISPLIIAAQPQLLESAIGVLNFLLGAIMIGLLTGIVALGWIWRPQHRRKSTLKFDSIKLPTEADET